MRKLRTARERYDAERRAKKMERLGKIRRSKANKEYWKEKTGTTRDCKGFNVPPHKLTEAEIAGKTVKEIHALKFSCRRRTKHPSGLCPTCRNREEVWTALRLKEAKITQDGYANSITGEYIPRRGPAYGNLLKNRHKDYCR